MVRDFLRFVPRPVDLVKALRKIALGGVIATTGLSVTPQAASPPSANESAGTSIVDRSRKVAKLILRLPGTASSFIAQHRSHRSHSSHRSHYSGSGGSVVAPAVPPPPPVAAPRAVSPAVPDPTAATVATIKMAGEVVSVDKEKRTFMFKQSESTSRTIGYRDDTKFETPAGASIRFDDFAAASSGLVPIAKGDKVELSWRMSSDGRMPIAVTILKKAQ
jgi:hypothetical protein